MQVNQSLGAQLAEDFPENRPLFAGCYSKDSYPTEVKAIAVAQKREAADPGLTLRVYRCENCLEWHLTKLKKEEKGMEDLTQEKILAAPISACPLHTKTKEAIITRGCQTVGDLVQHSAEELQLHPTTQARVEAFLAQYGLALKPPSFTFPEPPVKAATMSASLVYDYVPLDEAYAWVASRGKLNPLKRLGMELQRALDGLPAGQAIRYPVSDGKNVGKEAERLKKAARHVGLAITIRNTGNNANIIVMWPQTAEEREDAQRRAEILHRGRRTKKVAQS
jgi:hypothetical protein